MGTRIEVTRQLKGAYHRAGKSEKSGILDHFCHSTGLGRSTARRYLTSPTLGSRNILRMDRRRSRPSKYSTEAKKMLLWLWRIMCMPCGKYLVADLPGWIRSLETHGERCWVRTAGRRGTQELLSIGGNNGPVSESGA